jgi:gliding motility-associated-like protein
MNRIKIKIFYIFIIFNVFALNNLLAQCLIDYTYTMSPPPIDGTYGPNETVEFCFTIDEWSTLEGEWLHGLELDFGEGWDINSIITYPADNVGGSGNWGWYPNGINGGFESGFYFNYTLPNDLNPANNYGDFGFGPWIFCWTITTADGTDLSLDGASLDITINTLGDGESGSWFDIGCAGDPILSPPFESVLSLCDVTAGTFPTELCAVGFGSLDLFNEIDLFGSPTPGGEWTDDNGDIFSGIYLPGVNDTGSYTYTVTGLNDCTSSLTIDVFISDLGVLNTLSICSEEEDFNLFNQTGGEFPLNGSWVNPDELVTDSIFNVGIDPFGLYTYNYITSSNCQSTFAISVDELDFPNPGTDTSIILCAGSGTFDLFDLMAGNPEAGGVWLDPSMESVETFNSEDNIGGIFTYFTGNINCQVSAELEITIGSDANAGINSNANICSNTPPIDLFTFINGTPDLDGEWTDPDDNNFSGILDPETSLEGAYLYTVGSLGCESSAIIDVLITDYPTSILTGGANICFGENIILTIASEGNGPFDVVYTDGNSNFNLNNISANFSLNVSPIENTTYSLVSVSDNSSSPCAGTVSGNAIINVANIPTGEISGGGTFCLGETGSIIFDITGGSNYNLTYWDGAVETELINISDGFIQGFSPEFNSTFTLVEIYPVGFPSCAAETLNGNAVFMVNVAPVITNITENCTPENDGYIVTFNINGGDVSTYFEADGNGSISLNTFTSDFISNGVNYNFSIDDENLCGSIFVSGSNTCPCTSNAGNMNLTALEICSNQIANAIYNGGETLDGNDALIFILHDNSGAILGNVLATSATPIFEFDDFLMNTNNTYYISAVVANSDYLNDPCISVSIGTPVIFNLVPSANIDGLYQFCEGNSIEIDIIFEGESPFEFNYSLNDVEVETLTAENSTYQLNVSLEGDYEILTVSSNGCSAFGVGNASVLQIDSPSAQIIGDSNLCPNNNDGLEVELIGSPPFVLNYSIDGIAQPEIVTDNNIYLLEVNSTSNYSLISITDNNCSSILNENLDVILHTLPTAQITGGGEICQGGQVEFTVSLNGNSPYQFIYSNGLINQNINTNDDLFTFTSSIAGVYSIVEVEDEFCSGISIGSPAELIINSLPTATISLSDNPICEGENVALIFNLTGNSPFNVFYSVNGVEEFIENINNGYNIELTPVGNTSITLLNVTDYSINACESNYNNTTNVIVNNYPIIPELSDLKICSGESPQAIGIYPEQNVTYSWYPTNGIGNPNASNTNFSLFTDNLSPVVYAYTLIGNRGDCITSEAMEISIFPLPKPYFTYLPETITTENTLVDFKNQTLGKNIYIWNFNNIDFSNEVNPSYRFPDALEGIYSVGLTAIDTLIGCKNSYAENILIKGDLLVYVPTAFTPNSDGINDLLLVSVENYDPSYFHFTIYNRWGELIFESYDAGIKWNGSQENEKFYAQPQVFIWNLQTKNKFSTAIRTFKGQVTLLR